MTGRELVREIMATMKNIDDDIKVEILYRDEHNCVIDKDFAPVTRLSLNGISVEASNVQRNSTVVTNQFYKLGHR